MLKLVLLFISAVSAKYSGTFLIDHSNSTNTGPLIFAQTTEDGLEIVYSTKTVFVNGEKIFKPEFFQFLSEFEPHFGKAVAMGLDHLAEKTKNAENVDELFRGLAMGIANIYSLTREGLNRPRFNHRLHVRMD